MNGQGFTHATWRSAATWTSGCAGPHDVDSGGAVFAMGDTQNGHPMGWTLPQPVIWYDEDEEFAALVVQAEAHESEEGQELEVLGLLLPTGRTVVAFSEDVEVVTGDDPVWESLIEAELDADRMEPDEDDDSQRDEDEADDDRLA